MALPIDGSKKQSPARRQPYGASDQNLTKTELERWLPRILPLDGPLSREQVIGSAAAKLDTYGWYSEGVERVAPIWSTSPLVNPQFHHRLPENAQVTVKTIVLGILAALFVFVLSRRRLGVVPGLIAGALVLAAWVFEGVRHG
jgi:hypothetical protein